MAEPVETPEPERKPQVRPVFRKLAAVTAAVCIILGLLFAAVVPEEEGKWFSIGICLVMGLILAIIAQKGRWPP